MVDINQLHAVAFLIVLDAGNGVLAQRAPESSRGGPYAKQQSVRVLRQQ